MLLNYDREHRSLQQSDANRSTLEGEVAEAQGQPAEPARAEEQPELTIKLMSTGELRYIRSDVAADARMAWQLADNLVEI